LLFFDEWTVLRVENGYGTCTIDFYAHTKN
jgi:hypothetical protein